MDTLDAIVDIHERARLLAISPNLDLAGISSACDLPAHRSRRLLATAIIGAQRAIHVVEAHDARRQAVVLGIVLAELLRVELFEAVPFLGLRRPRVLLAQRRYVRRGLQVVSIDAGG